MRLRIAHIVRIGSGHPDPLADQPDEFGAIKTTGILGVGPVGDVGDGEHSGAISQPRPQKEFAVNGGHLFPLAQIGERGACFRRRDAKGDALAGAAAIEAQGRGPGRSLVPR